MATPCREQILAALEAALGTITALDGLTVERDREEAVTGDDVPVLVLFEGEDAAPEYLTGIEVRRLSVDVEGYVLADSRAAAASAAAVLRAEAERVLQADPTLGGKAWDVSPAQEPSPQRLDLAAERPGYGFVLSLTVTYGIVQGDPYSFA